MNIIKTTLLAFLFGLNVFSVNAFADLKDYSEAEFHKSLQSGSTVVLDFYASWCPTCRAQAKVFDILLKEEKFSGVTIYKVDFDKADELKKKYAVTKQSTLILFNDQQEIERSIGVKDINVLRDFLSKGLQ